MRYWYVTFTDRRKPKSGLGRFVWAVSPEEALGILPAGYVIRTFGIKPETTKGGGLRWNISKQETLDIYEVQV